MKTPLIFFMGGKISPIDNHLPLLLELIQLNIVDKLYIIVVDPTFYEMYKEQKFLKKIIDSNDNIKIIINKDPDNKLKSWNYTRPYRENIINKIRRLINTFLSIRFILYKKTWFLNSFKTNKILKLLITYNKRLLGGFSFESRLEPTSEQLHKWFTNILKNQFKRNLKTHITPSVDAVLTSLPSKYYNFEHNQKCIAINLGYIRGFKTWNTHIKSSNRNDFEHQISDNYFFWPLSVLEREEENGIKYTLDNIILETFTILKEIDCPIQAVLRYHPTTDPNRFNEILNMSKFDNYVFSNAHPHTLIANAKFIFSNSGLLYLFLSDIVSFNKFSI